jgi:type VI secretion system secreted protein Hcp
MALADMFLRVEGARQGAIKGEASDPAHKDEIEVKSWSWGMQGGLVHGMAAAETTLHELKVVKHVDSATTALMSSLRNNELIKQAVLTVRKAGGAEAVEYLKITLDKARITSLFTRSGEEEDPSVLTEELSIAFAKVTVEYQPQGPDGARRGGMLFEAEIGPG